MGKWENVKMGGGMIYGLAVDPISTITGLPNY